MRQKSSGKTASIQDEDFLHIFHRKVRLPALLIAAVCIIVLAVHWPALSAKTLSFDDGQYLTDNTLVQNPCWKSAKRFLTEVLEPSTVEGYYQPLSMISRMLDCTIGGNENNLMPFHRTSLILHIANTTLIIILLYLLFGQIWIAAGVGLLFGVHPMTVEPIPWVSERKTLLAVFFSLWSLILYVCSRITSHRSRVTGFYIGSFIAYLLALMSKPISIPLPVVMLLMDYWPLKRLSWRSVFEKLPFFVLGGISTIITVISQTRTCETKMPSQFSPARIPLVLCHNIIFYLYKIIWPVNLSSCYPFPEPLNLSQPMVLAGVIGTFALILLLALSLRWTRAALTGWLIFFIAILPTMQIITFSNVIASDKFAYLPSIGLLMILASFLVWLCRSKFLTLCRVSVVIILLAVCAESIATRLYLTYWQNRDSLVKYMLKLTPDVAQLHSMLGLTFQLQGKVDEAVNHYRQAIKLRPDYVQAYNNLGLALSSQGRFDEAVGQFNRALQMSPDFSDAYYNLAIALKSQGKLDDAITNYRLAIQFNPDYAEAHHNLGNVLEIQGKTDEAAAHYRHAIRIKPNDAKAHNNLGIILKTQGKLDEAISHYRQALQSDPNYAEACSNIGNALILQNKLDEAAGYYRRALTIKPDYPEAYYNLGIVLEKQSKFREAAENYCQAVRLKPDWQAPLKNAEKILALLPDPNSELADRIHKRLELYKQVKP